LSSAAEADRATEILHALPRRIHRVLERPARDLADHPALVEDGASWTYRELQQSVGEVAASLRSLGVRPGDRLMLVSENCIALAALLLASSRIDAWAIVVNPRLSFRELDQIRDHSGARRVLFTAGIFRGKRPATRRATARARKTLVRSEISASVRSRRRPSPSPLKKAPPGRSRFLFTHRAPRAPRRA
jgi:acyl-CoA synthetase (AMP-forming)/AMP-acid ligase II